MGFENFKFEPKRFEACTICSTPIKGVAPICRSPVCAESFRLQRKEFEARHATQKPSAIAFYLSRGEEDGQS